MDLPIRFHDICNADGYADEARPFGAPGCVLTPENHTGTKEYYTERSYTIHTNKVAEMTGIKGVVLGTYECYNFCLSQIKTQFFFKSIGTTPCGQGAMKFPHNNVHFYHTSAKDECQEYRCVTGGGYFYKPYAEQCSDRGRKFNMGGNDPRVLGGIFCDGANPQFGTKRKNLPAGFTWSIYYPPIGMTNSATGSQGQHGTNLDELLGQYESVPKHLILQYDGELIANHAHRFCCIRERFRWQK